VEQAQQESQAAYASLQLARAKVSYDLKAAYANMLYAKETEKITKDFQKRREDNLRMVELRYQSGRENKGSLLLSQAYLAQAKVDVLKARNARETSQSDLRKVLGWDDERDFDIEETLPLQEKVSPAVDYKAIAAATPLRLQAEAQVGVSQAGVTSARSGFYPSLSLTGSLGKADTQFFPERDRWSVGATLSWPLFGGGKDYYASQSATSGLRAAKSNLSNVERGLQSTLKKAHTAFIEAVEDFKVSEAFLKAAQSRAEIARSKYNNGLMTFDEWDIIENDLINKSKIFLQAKRERILAEAAWEQAQGTGVIP
jgi:outer membrane protein TolC